MLLTEKNDLLEKVNAALDDIRPHLVVDGGNVEVVDVTEDMLVRIKWMGACENCSMSAMTLRAGIEQTLRNKFPEITGVVAINA